MSNSKRIQRKVAKLEQRKYKRLLSFMLNIDARPFIEALEKVKESIEAVNRSVQNLKFEFKHEQL